MAADTTNTGNTMGSGVRVGAGGAGGMGMGPGAGVMGFQGQMRRELDEAYAAKTPSDRRRALNQHV